MAPLSAAMLRRRYGLTPLWDVGDKAFVVLAFLAIGLLFGCGGPPRAAQTALSATAEGVLLADRALTPMVTEAADRSRAAALEVVALAEEGVDGSAAALARYDELMAPWSAAVRTLEEARSALLALQAGLRAWKAKVDGADMAWLSAVACALPIIAELVNVLRRAGVGVPEQLTSAMRLLLGFAGGRCEVQP